MKNMEKYYHVGYIIKSHGLKGEVKVMSDTDFKEERFKPGSQLALFKDDTFKEIVTVASWRYQKPYDVIRFEEYDSINDIEGFKGLSLQVSAADRADTLEQDSFYYDDIIGLTIENLNGEAVGTITSIMSPGANDVWVMECTTDHQEVLIPYIKDVVKSVDLESGIATVDFIEGLMEDED